MSSKKTVKKNDHELPILPEMWDFKLQTSQKQHSTKEG